MLPTFADIAGIQKSERPTQLDGISFLPTLQGNMMAQQTHPYLYWEFHEQNGKVAARFGKWKGIRLNVSKKPDGPIEVYDLENDLAEKTNIADENPEIVAKFKEIFREAHTPSTIFSALDKGK
jgi:arylsulfatase A-like enzyme